MATKDTVFRSTRPEAKAARIDNAAREIIRHQTEARLTKTERLKAARLEKEAAERLEAPAEAPKRKPAKRTRRATS